MQTLKTKEKPEFDTADLPAAQSLHMQPPASDEVDLLSEHLSGDRQAFTDLVKKYERTIQQYFYRQAKDHQLAEDLTQELFLKVARLTGRYEARGHLDSYLLHIAKNLWIDRYRQQSLRPGMQHFGSSDAEEASEIERKLYDGAGPLEVALLQDQVQKLRRAVGRLDPKHRQVVELDLNKQFEQAEIADELGIPTGTVKSRKFNAIDRLAVLFQKLRQ